MRSGSSSLSFDEAVRNAQAALAAKDHAAAEKFYRAALDQRSDDSWVLFSLAVLVQQQQRWEEAARLYRLLLVFSPGHAEARVNLAKILFDAAVRAGQAGDEEACARQYEAALKVDAACFPARLNLTKLAEQVPSRFRARYRPALVATVPRSGTYFTVHVFEFLERRSGGHSADYDPAPADGLFDRVLIFPNLRLFKLTLHGICPGFEADYRGKLRAAWDEAAGASAPERVPAELAEWFDPRSHGDVRLVHIYRSPAEQVLSNFRMQVRLGKVENRPAALSEQVAPVMRQFVAQYLSFAIMKERLPEQILLMDFRQLIKEPVAAFTAMLGHFGRPAPAPALLAGAIEASSPAQLAKTEDRLGRPTGPGGTLSHFDRTRDAAESFGLSATDEAVIRDMLERFEIDPALF